MLLLSVLAFIIGLSERGHARKLIYSVARSLCWEHAA
jgi:hypothetical protein